MSNIVTPVVAKRYRLTVLCGPTAVGKGTVVALLRKRIPELFVSISATTRSARPGEMDGVHYHFLTPAKFEQLDQEGQLLESATVHGLYRYGTMRAPVMEALDAGRPALLEIDLAGARQVKQVMPEATFVFLLPPSWEELERRLKGRATETVEEQQRRLATAKVEMAAAGEFEFQVVNDDLERAVTELIPIICA